MTAPTPTEPLDTRLLNLALLAGSGTDLRRALVRAADAVLIQRLGEGNPAQHFDDAPIRAIRRELLQNPETIDAASLYVLRALDQALNYVALENWTATRSDAPPHASGAHPPRPSS